MTGEIDVQFTRAEALRILGLLGPEPGNPTDRAIAAKVQSAGELLPMEAEHALGSPPLTTLASRVPDRSTLEPALDLATA
jgi:hypothetical protein